MCCFRREEVLLLEGLQFHQRRLQELFHCKRLQVHACHKQRTGGGGDSTLTGQGAGRGAAVAVPAVGAAAIEIRFSERREKESN